MHEEYSPMYLEYEKFVVRFNVSWETEETNRIRKSLAYISNNCDHRRDQGGLYLRRGTKANQFLKRKNAKERKTLWTEGFEKWFLIISQATTELSNSCEVFAEWSTNHFMTHCQPDIDVLLSGCQHVQKLAQKPKTQLAGNGYHTLEWKRIESNWDVS